MATSSQIAAANTEFSTEAARLAAFIPEFWLACRRPPNLGDIYASLGFDYSVVRRLFRELQLGFAVAALHDRLQLNLMKAPPLSAIPTPLKLIVAGEFVSYVGCAAEAFSLGGTAQLANADYEVQSHCVRCYAPLALSFSGLVVHSSADAPVVALTGNPRLWEYGVPADRVCDDFHLACSADHAYEFGRSVSRRCVIVTVAQQAELSRTVAAARLRSAAAMVWLDAHAQIERFREVGVDVSEWIE